MIGGRDLSKRKRLFSLIASVMLILSILLIGITIQIPNATAVTVNHNVSNVKINSLTDYGRVLMPILRGVIQSTDDPSTGIGFIGLVIDQDNYNHTPGSVDIADSFSIYPYTLQGDFTNVRDVTMIINDGVTQKSIASFQNTGIGTGDPNDILIDQKVWTVLNKDWAVLQWTLINLKNVPLTGVCIGLELPLSQAGAEMGVGGDSGDDIDGFDAANNVYWAQDDGGAGDCIGFGSAIVSDPLTHYYSEDYTVDYETEYKFYYENDAWLYDRIHAPNATVGAVTGSRSSNVGWNNITINRGESRTFTLVIAVNETFGSMITAFKDAQYYYHNVATSFQITEFSDDQSGVTPQRIEVYNVGFEPTDLAGKGYFISLDGITPLSGSWGPTYIPTYGYSVFTVTGTPIGPEGDTLGLYQDLGGGNIVLVDGPFSYGQEGVVPDPLDGESVARRYLTASASYSDEWLRNASTGPTWNAQNDVGRVKVSHVILNRVMFNPMSAIEEGYVELMYRSHGTLDISNYRIVCDDEFIVPSGTILNLTNRFYVLNQSNYPPNFDLDDGSVNGDNVYLYDNKSNLVDMVGWSSPHNPGEFMSRIPEGRGTYQGYNDTTSQAAGWVFNQWPSLMITEFFANGTSAQIEVYNARGGTKFLDYIPQRWTFDVELGTLTGNWALTTIPRGGYSTFTMISGTPGDEGDTIRLYYNGSMRDDISFGIKGVAPDPLVGESSARCWDTSIGGYGNDWARAPASTFGAQNDVPPINSSSFIILNEVMFNPRTPDGGYIVIINKEHRGWVNVRDYYIVCDNVYQLSAFGDIWLYPFEKYMIKYDLANPAFFQNMTPAGDNVYLYDNNGRLLDMVGWNSPHTQGMSVRRVPDGKGTYNGYNDTTSEAAGWVFNSAFQVLMTEISDNESKVAQIEVYNNLYPIIDFRSGFTFQSASFGTLSGGWSIPTADKYEYALFNVTTPNGLDPEGDTISLYQNGALVEKISYGQKGIVPDPLPNESVERVYYSGYYTNLWSRNWTSGPTFGIENNVPLHAYTKAVVLNEIMFNPSASEDGVVELYLREGPRLNISGFKIVGDSEYIIPTGVELIPDYRYYYLSQPMDPAFFAALNSSGDNVYLYDDNGSLLDMAGWSSAHEIDKTMARVPDGLGGSGGFDDTTSEAAGWVFNQIPSYAYVDVKENQAKWGDPGYSVWYLLNITNHQNVADYFDVIVQSENGWLIELFEGDLSSLLVDKESPPDGLPDTGLLLPKIPYRIWVRVFVPLPPNVEVDKTNVTAQASLNTSWRDSVLLKTFVNPWLEPDAYIEDPPYPTTIYEKSAGVSGFTNETTVTLNATGMRHQRYTAQDVIFILDSSGSMSWNDPDPDDKPGNYPFPQRVKASWDYVNNLTGSDRGGYVDFDSEATLNVSLTTNYSYLKADPVNGLWCSDQKGSTRINPALSIANQELIVNGSPNHVKVEILLTDAESIFSDDDNLCRQQADIAAANDIIIFTIGLNVDQQGPPGGVDLLRYIATTTDGQYYPAPDASALTEIFSQIFRRVSNIAGYNPHPMGEDVMIKFVLGQGIDYIDGTFQLVPGTIEMNPNPDKVTFNPTNTTLEWKWATDHIRVEEYWAIRFNISSTILGANVPVNVVPDSSIFYMTFDRALITKEFPLLTINVLPKPAIPPRITNVTIDPGGVNITWNPVIGAEFYEIYGGPSQTSLNLDLVDVLDTVSAPQTWWLDAINLPIYDEYYYVVRAIDIDTIPYARSLTSNTGGYYKRQFCAGLNTFSLPLEPFGNFDIDYYTIRMNAEYIRYMDPMNHTWRQHNLGDCSTNNTQLKLGEGYEVKLSSHTTFTFTGMPGAMISYDDDNGFLGFDHSNEAKNLIVSVEPNGDVNLSWQEPTGMGVGDWYVVYYSNKRDGFFGAIDSDYFFACPPVNFGNNTATHISAKASDPGARLFYMVVPFNASGVRGSSTYSIGIWTEEYLSQYDTFGIPLKLSTNHTADWYCDNIPNTVGINYYIYNEQRWGWHSTRMFEGAYDPILVMTNGYQISTSNTTKFTFIGV